MIRIRPCRTESRPGTRFAFSAPIGRDPRLEQLLQRPIGAKFRIPTGCRRRRPSRGSCINSGNLEVSPLRLDPERRPGGIATAARRREGPDFRSHKSGCSGLRDPRCLRARGRGRVSHRPSRRRRRRLPGGWTLRGGAIPRPGPADRPDGTSAQARPGRPGADPGAPTRGRGEVPVIRQEVNLRDQTARFEISPGNISGPWKKSRRAS